jgi:malate dehydrogenase (oxaloacetate-decarboxylating)
VRGQKPGPAAAATLERPLLVYQHEPHQGEVDMERYGLTRDALGRSRLECPYRGTRLLRHPFYTKGTAFSEEERHALGLEGLLPSHVSTIGEQSRRAYENITRKSDPLEKFIGLAALQDRNEHLFYRVLVDHLADLLPIVYTPTVGLACQRWSHIFRRARGLWITPAHRGRIGRILENAPFEDVRLVVVTDNERILGLGDQGAGGMGIPIGKLALYSAAAGIPPWQTLPVSLDVGTNNQALLDDDLYLGWRDRRLRGEEYDGLVDEFVDAIKVRFPRAVLQWEDFKKCNAFRLLERHRLTLPSFNDDIQGTAAVAVAGIIAGAHRTGVPLRDQRVVVLGAGAAGIGIARLLRLTLERAGLSGDALRFAIANLDTQGLLVDDRPIEDEHKRPFAWPRALAEAKGLGGEKPRNLLAVVRASKPTVLIGTSGEPGWFTEEVVREMARHVERPLILPLSNPTSQSEAVPADVIRWTDARALVATGSPFDPVPWGGREIRIGQANNAFVFPGVGLGVLVSEAREVTEEMFAAAAGALAGQVSAADRAEGCLFPRIDDLRLVTAHVAQAVVREALHSGVAGRRVDDVPEAVARATWDPDYVPMEAVPLSRGVELAFSGV